MVWLAVCTWATRSTKIPPVMSVLIVDDHPTFRASARRLLEAEGFDVIGEAGDGHAAIEAAQQLSRTWCSSTCNCLISTASSRQWHND